MLSRSVLTLSLPRHHQMGAMSSASEPATKIEKVEELSKKDEAKLDEFYGKLRPKEEVEYYAVAWVERSGAVSSSVQVEKLEKPRGVLPRGYYLKGGGGSEFDVRKMVAAAIKKYPILRVVLSTANDTALKLYKSLGFSETWHDTKEIDGDEKVLLTYNGPSDDSDGKRKPKARGKKREESAAAPAEDDETDE